VSTSPIEVLNRRLLHIEVADRLREMIMWGQLEPGQRLNERQFCERFDISRTPLREAFMILSSEGLLKLLPNRGAMVTPLTLTELEDMFQVMAVLEGLAGELACQRATEQDIAEIAALHLKMLEHHSRDELRPYFEANQNIHQKIVDCARNAELTDIYKKLSVRIRRARYMANFSKERWDQAVNEHHEILEALKRRNSRELKTLLQRHLKNKYEVIMAWMQQSAKS
jgi:DNA-binding GntR family transcriptional regulator